MSRLRRPPGAQLLNCLGGFVCSGSLRAGHQSQDAVWQHEQSGHAVSAGGGTGRLVDVDCADRNGDGLRRRRHRAGGKR